MKKIVLTTIAILLMVGCNNGSTKEQKEEKETLHIDSVECTYDTKPNKEYPYMVIC